MNGKQHNIHGSTYSSTLCRETFLTLMHIGAVLDWNFFHFDEKRSISERLKTWWHHYKSQNSWRFPILRNYWSTIWPKDCFDYKTTVQWSLERMQFLGFSTLDYCISTYYKSQSRNICIIYEYVDNFIFTGNNKNLILQNFCQFREKHPQLSLKSNLRSILV